MRSTPFLVNQKPARPPLPWLQRDGDCHRGCVPFVETS